MSYEPVMDLKHIPYRIDFTAESKKHLFLYACYITIYRTGSMLTEMYEVKLNEPKVYHHFLFGKEANLDSH